MIAFVIDNLGPYHIARLNEVVKRACVEVIQISAKSDEYEWTSRQKIEFKVHTIKNEREYKISVDSLQEKISCKLSELQPTHIFVSGWSSSADLSALYWGQFNKIPVIVMSDSQKNDFKRNSVIEFGKKLIVSSFSAAFVGGSRHEEYVHSLGISSNKIRIGYDVVDNLHFETSDPLSRRGFLACARFIEKKNLIGLIDAYSEYCKLAVSSGRSEDVWGLTIIGDGPLRSVIENAVNNSKRAISLVGFKSYEEMPFLYSTAGVFVHLSYVEQWGLVVNEAMASGLPVLISKNCGCYPELVLEGENGYGVDPYDTKNIANLMFYFTEISELERRRYGNRSLQIIRRYSLEDHANSILSFKRDIEFVLPIHKRLLSIISIRILFLIRKIFSE